MIVFRKQNDVYLEAIEGERDELRMLSDYFTFEVPGARFTPAFKNKFWDGKLRLFDMRKMTIYCGLMADITRFSKEFDIEIAVDAPRHMIPGLEQDIDDKTLDGFVKALNLHSRGQPIEMRDYQLDAFKTSVRKQRQLILSPTSSGKSLIIYALARWWREVHERKILIVVPTVGLVTQLISDFNDYSQGQFDDVYGISAGIEKDTDARIIITTWQSIYDMGAGWFAQFGSVVVDEVHHATAKSIQGIMHKLLICPDRIGMTGTLQDAKTHELVLKGLFGSVHKTISTKQLMEKDIVAQMKVEVIHLKYNKEDSKHVKPMEYQDELSFLVNHQVRNNFISRLASSLTGNTLVVFSRLDQGKQLFDLIETTKEKFYVAGETDKDVREMVRQFTEKNDVIIVASLGVFSTGINIRNLHNLIFAHPTKSKIKVLQSIGRILRKTDDDKPATVYDIVDDLHVGTRENFTLRHSSERMKYYINENFNYNIKSIQLP